MSTHANHKMYIEVTVELENSFALQAVAKDIMHLIQSWECPTGEQEARVMDISCKRAEVVSFGSST